MQMSNFMRDKDGVFHGKIQGLGFGSVPVMSQIATSKEGKTYYRLFADPLGDPYEVGRFWPKQTDSGMHYFSVSLESPFLPAPVKAALFPVDDMPNNYHLVWQRQQFKPELTVDKEIGMDQQLPFVAASTQAEPNNAKPPKAGRSFRGGSPNI